jgi:hypothetical protein
MMWWRLLPGSERGFILAVIFLFAGCIACWGGAWIWIAIRKRSAIKKGPAVSSGPLGLVVLGFFSFFFFMIFLFVARPLKLARFIHTVEPGVEWSGSESDVSFSGGISGGSGSDSSSWGSGASDSASWDSGASDSASWDSGASDSASWDSGASDSASWDSGAWDSGSSDSGSWDSDGGDSDGGDSGGGDDGD